MVSDRIDDVPDNVFHVPGRINSTWGGNLADMVRGARYLEIIEEDSLVENADRAGDHLLGGLTKIASEWLDVTNVRGRGLFVAFTLPSTKLRNDVRQTCWDLGLATLASGATSIRFRPCLNVSGEEIDLGLGILRRALERHLPKRAEATNG
jgi:L-lysine 6-transaminase